MGNDRLLKDEAATEEKKGYRARLSSLLGAMSIADLVKTTTLGPKGMEDKIQQSSGRGRSVTVTNDDGATTLKSLHVDNPAAIADNAGLDSAELISQLRAEHHKEESNAGIDVITGTVGDMEKLGVSEAHLR